VAGGFAGYARRMTIAQPASSVPSLGLPLSLTDPAVPSLPGSLRRAREAVETAALDYLAVPEAALERQWLWRGHDHGDGVRYGIYRGAETVEAAGAELEAALAGAPARSPAAVRAAPATIARWSLQGRLVALDDSLLDVVPTAGEWTARQTLAHTIDGQRSYGWFSRWWLSQPLGESRPARVTDEAERASHAELPGEEAEGAGSVADIRARLDAVLDEWALRFAALDAGSLAAPATWAGIAVDIDFRIGRWASHIAEHTIQLDKTLAWLGQQPTEPARIVRQLYEAWGRLEARVFPTLPEGTDAAVASILDRMSDTLVTEAASARAAADV
jgi:DinB superfamily